jgi:flagellar biosynthesis/type III secretory pathway protein FliH
MAGTFSVILAEPVGSVEILKNYGRNGQQSIIDQTAIPCQGEDENLNEQLQSQVLLYDQMNQTLAAIIEKLEGFYNEIFAGHKEQIAKLSVDIARKILVQKVDQGDYQIESIVKEVLASAPSNQDIVIYLNPQDLVTCRKAQENGTFAGVKLAEDPNIDRAQCRLESPKGIINSLIEEHLEQIEKMLAKLE